MRLTILTDLALRTLMYLGSEADRLCPVGEIARAYDVSDAHTMKAVRRLKSVGLVEGVRGQKGGIRLTRPPEEIRLGEAVRLLEDNFRLAECFDAKTNRCVVTRSCALYGKLGEALDAFFAVLDRYTLADVLAESTGIRTIYEERLTVARETAPHRPAGAGPS